MEKKTRMWTRKTQCMDARDTHILAGQFTLKTLEALQHTKSNLKNTKNTVISSRLPYSYRRFTLVDLSSIASGIIQHHHKHSDPTSSACGPSRQRTDQNCQRQLLFRVSLWGGCKYIYACRHSLPLLLLAAIPPQYGSALIVAQRWSVTSIEVINCRCLLKASKGLKFASLDSF